MQPSTEMMSYQNPPIIKKDGTAVPLGMTITPPPTTPITPTTRSHHWTWMGRVVAVVVAGMMLVVGGAVWRQEGSLYQHSFDASLETEDGSLTTNVEATVSKHLKSFYYGHAKLA